MEWNGHNPLAPQPRSRTQRLSPVHIRRQEARRERCIYQFSYPPLLLPRRQVGTAPPPLSLRYRESREYCFATHFGRPGRLDSAGQAKSWFSPRNPNLWSRSYLDSPLSLSVVEKRAGKGGMESEIPPRRSAHFLLPMWDFQSGRR